jgi:TonB family protein
MPPLSKRRKKWLARAVVAAVIALVGHAVIIALFVTFAGDLPAALSNPAKVVTAAPLAEVDDDRPMEIETLVDELDRPEVKTAEEKRREDAAKKEEDDKNPHGQVVDIAKPAIEQRPDHANFVSEYDSKVDRETKGPSARDHAGGREQPDDSRLLPPVPPSVKAAPAPGMPGARPGRPGPLAMRELPQRNRSGQEGSVDEARERDGEMPHPGQRSQAAARPSREPPGEMGSGLPPGQNGEQRREGGALDLKPNVDLLQKAIGRGSGSMDYLKDVDDGESTALNSKKWAHAAFFNRVKRQVADQWHPDVVYVQHDPHGNVYGVKDRVTVLRIHLKPDGHMGTWTMLQSSGVDFLDDEAIRAFQKAQPFPNPPRALIESDGQIHFNFAFIFELSGRTNFKVFKY